MNRSTASLFRLVFLINGFKTFQLGKVLHQTLIEVHTAADEVLAAIVQAAPTRPGNYIVPSCRPIQKGGLIAFTRRS
jgi:hypothetical protein